MKIGVSGADGRLGRAVVSELLQRARGHEVMAIMRRLPSRTSESSHRRCWSAR
jgi:NAD(P)H dehydrogenase (quinone)